MLAVISFSSTHWLLPAGLLLAVAATLVWFGYRQADAKSRIRLAARTLKWTALALLAVCLIEPVWSGVQAKPQANLFVVLADNSQSLTAHNGPKKSLADQLKTFVAPTEKSHWLTTLAQDYGLQQFVFDRRLRQVNGLDQWDWQGEQSLLKGSWAGLKQRFQGRPIGGVLLLSDGQATDCSLAEIDAQAADWRGLGPCYPVVFEDSTPLPDVAIDSVAVTETSFEDAPVTVTCDVRTTGLGELKNRKLVCQLIGPDGAVVEEQTAVLAANEEHSAFRFQLKPNAKELAFYAVEAVLAPSENEPMNEATLANNRRLVLVNRGAVEHRVLYVSGRPNWEFKFIRRAIDEDDQIDLVGMVRIAKREAKFDFRGRDGQSSNSLFRGFKKDSDEETERFDEPVIVRLNTKTPDELRAGFPKTADALFPFDAIILDDIEAGFFTRDQLTLIGRFVSERGGGLLMLGGQESFTIGGYERSPIADALPVYLDRAKSPGEDIGLKLHLTREGWLQPWTRLRKTEAEERERMAVVPPFKTMNPTRGVKPGASVLATVTDGAGTHWPALVTQQFGRGHAGAMLVGDLWRAQLQESEATRGDLAKAWRQTIRWLVSEVSQRVDVTTEPAPDVSADAVRVRVRAVDAEFRSLDNARVQVQVSGPLGISSIDADSTEKVEVTLEAEPINDQPGTYSAVFVPRGIGGWKLSTKAIDGDGQELPVATTGWIHDPLADEFRRTGSNRAGLEKLAEVTGGRVIEAREIESFVAGLKHEPMPVMEAWTMPLWDHPLVFVVVLACLIGEWTLRRLAGLA